jgi:aminopeptidase N
VISAEVSGARCEIPVLPGEPVPAAVVPNDGDLTYAQISFEPATLEALAEAAMNTGDPMTEAACWNAAWRMVTSGALSGADLAGLVTRRLAGSPPLPAVGLEVLLGWAVTAADLYTADTERSGARAALAAASLAGAGAAAGGSPAQRTLAAGFAASAYSGDQLAQARAWLDGGERAVGTRPGGAAGRLPGPVLRRGAARAGRAGHPPDAAAGPGAVPGHAGRARDAGGDRVGGEA